MKVFDVQVSCVHLSKYISSTFWFVFLLNHWCRWQLKIYESLGVYLLIVASFQDKIFEYRWKWKQSPLCICLTAGESTILSVAQTILVWKQCLEQPLFLSLMLIFVTLLMTHEINVMDTSDHYLWTSCTMPFDRCCSYLFININMEFGSYMLDMFSPHPNPLTMRYLTLREGFIQFWITFSRLLSFD